MSSRLKSILLLYILLFSVGCASGPKYAEVVDTIPALSPEQGRIYMYRTTVLGAALRPDIKLNGEVIGSSVAKGFTFVDRPPGDYKIMTSTEVERSLSFVLEKDQTRFVKFDVSMGFFVGHVYPKLVDNETGGKELSGCSYIAPE